MDANAGEEFGSDSDEDGESSYNDVLIEESYNDEDYDYMDFV